jgi:hypothetical protein
VSERMRGGLGRVLTRGGRGAARTWRTHTGCWARRACTEEKGQEEETGMHHTVNGREVRSLVKYSIRGRPVGLEGGRRTRTRQVVDIMSFVRARSGEAEINKKKLEA